MYQEASDAPVICAGHMVSRGPLRLDGDELNVMIHVSGPDASPRFPTDHVVFMRPGDSEKLRSRDSYGGYEVDGSAFFLCRLDWPGGNQVEIIYFEDGDQVVHRELVKVVP